MTHLHCHPSAFASLRLCESPLRPGLQYGFQPRPALGVQLPPIGDLEPVAVDVEDQEVVLAEPDARFREALHDEVALALIRHHVPVSDAELGPDAGDGPDA